eukprot:2778358-Prymnesium_polylepis.1
MTGSRNDRLVVPLVWGWLYQNHVARDGAAGRVAARGGAEESRGLTGRALRRVPGIPHGSARVGRGGHHGGH